MISQKSPTKTNVQSMRSAPRSARRGSPSRFRLDMLPDWYGFTFCHTADPTGIIDIETVNGEGRIQYAAQASVDAGVWVGEIGDGVRVREVALRTPCLFLRLGRPMRVSVADDVTGRVDDT